MHDILSDLNDLKYSLTLTRREELYMKGTKNIVVSIVEMKFNCVRFAHQHSLYIRSQLQPIQYN